MTNERPYLLVAPYLPLSKRIEVDEWSVGPPEAFEAAWADRGFQEAATAFMEKFRNAEGRPIERPALIAPRAGPIDGAFPGAERFEALQLALHFGLLDANPLWHPDADGWWTATTDNSDLWAQPIDLAGHRVTLVRGSLVRVTSGGWKTTDPNMQIRAPLELHLPQEARFNVDAATAIYRTARGVHNDVDAALARRVAIAVRLLAKAWRNSPSIGGEDRIVMLRTGFEALAGVSTTAAAGAAIEAVFAQLRARGASAESTAHLLWNPDERSDRPLTYPEGGKQKTIPVSDLRHWFAALASVRNEVIHEGTVPEISYAEAGSAYAGPFFHVGERVLREAIKVSLLRFAYDDLWRDPMSRLLAKTWSQFVADQRKTVVDVLAAAAALPSWPPPSPGGDSREGVAVPNVRSVERIPDSGRVAET